MSKILCLAMVAALGTIATPGARADAIPPPNELNEAQKALIGVWTQESCSYPEGLGHACASRILAFGNERYSELGFSYMPPSNFYGTSESGGAWTAAQTDAQHMTVTVKREDGNTQELTVTFESPNAILVKDTYYAIYPEVRFTRSGSPVQPQNK